MVERVVRAVPPAGQPVLAEIFDQAADYHARPSRRLATGEQVYDVHGFFLWVLDLHIGVSRLPDEIPTSLLVAWRDGHARHPAGASPIPLHLCTRCAVGLPNCGPGGHLGRFGECPVCDGAVGY